MTLLQGVYYLSVMTVLPPIFTGSNEPTLLTEISMDGFLIANRPENGRECPARCWETGRRLCIPPTKCIQRTN